MLLPLHRLLLFGFHRSSNRYRSPLSSLLAGHRFGLYLFRLPRTLFLLRRAVSLFRAVHRRRGRVWFSSPLTPAGSLSNWRQRSPRRSLPCLVVLLSPSAAPLGKEATRLGIPTIASLVGDWEADWITYPVPGGTPFPLLRLLLSAGSR